MEEKRGGCLGVEVEDVLQPGKLCVCMTQSAVAQMAQQTRRRYREQAIFCLSGANANTEGSNFWRRQ